MVYLLYKLDFFDCLVIFFIVHLDNNNILYYIGPLYNIIYYILRVIVNTPFFYEKGGVFQTVLQASHWNASQNDWRTFTFQSRWEFYFRFVSGSGNKREKRFSTFSHRFFRRAKTREKIVKKRFFPNFLCSQNREE